MNIYLVQHGEAVAKEVDPERPLTESGRSDVRRMASFLGAAGVRVSRIMHSGKVRAKETAELLAAAVAPGMAPQQAPPKASEDAFTAIRYATWTTNATSS